MKAALATTKEIMSAVNDAFQQNWLYWMGVILLLKSAGQQYGGNHEAGGLFAVAASVFIVGNALRNRR